MREVLKSKQWLAYVLVVVMVLGSGCSRSNDMGSETGTGQEESTADPNQGGGAALEGEDLNISYIILDKIDNTFEEVIYTGISQISGDLILPAENHKFVVVEMLFTDELTIDPAMALELNGNKYEQMTNAEELLDIIQYPYVGTAVTGSGPYYTVFEVAAADAETSDEGWKLYYDESFYSLAGRMSVNVSKTKLAVSEQWEKERDILAEAAAGNYSLKEPYLIQNPYGNAPLTAMMIFETDQPVRISLEIKGKTTDTGIRQDFESYSTYHEIPVIGLYADYENEVTITSYLEDGTPAETNTLQIQTPELSEEAKDFVTVDDYNKEEVKPGLFFAISSQLVLIDLDGEVRWFSTEPIGTSGVTHFFDNGHFVYSTSPYVFFAETYEMDFMGKIYWMFDNNSTAHHDANVTPDNYYVYISENDTIKVIDRENNVQKRVFDLPEFKDGRYSIEERSGGDTEDILHANTINFDGDNMILSLRNQHIVTSIDYYTEEVNWVLSPSISYYPELEEKFLTPVSEDFEWFYSQHEPVVLPDLDHNGNTIDILLFDNGVSRSIYKVSEPLDYQDRYSRIVHYRINERDMTVEQIFEFGKEQGTELYSAIHSGVEYLEDESSYVGTFDAYSSNESLGSDNNQAQIYQIDLSGDVKWHATIKGDTYLYRSYKKQWGDIYKGITPLFTERAAVFIDKNVMEKADKYEESTITYNISELILKDNYLNIGGWAYLNDYVIDDYPTYVYLKEQEADEVYRFALDFDHLVSFKDDFKGVENSQNQNESIYYGFRKSNVDLSSLEPGTYELSLVFMVDGKMTGQQIPYKIELEKSELNTFSFASQQVQLEKQYQLYNNGDYSFENPKVILNPYHVAPLTASIGFTTSEPVKVEVTIAGKDDLTTITHEFTEYSTDHEIPIYGLYAAADNDVLIRITDQQNNVKENRLVIKTDPLPEGFINVEIKEKADGFSDKGINFISSMMSGMVGFDANGDIRWYCNYFNSFAYVSPIKVLKNGNLGLFGGDLEPAYYSSHLFEVNLLGKVIRSYEIPRNSGHHDFVEMENGNLLVLSGHTSLGVAEDSMLEYDRTTGEIIRSIDFKDVMPLKEYITSDIYIEDKIGTATQNLKKEGKENPSDEEVWEEAKKLSSHDWIHVNALVYTKEDNSITLSSRNLNSIINFNYETLELNWIFSDPENNLYVNNPELQAYLLAPATDDFMYIYGQHSVNYLSNGNMILFDNHYNENATKQTEDETNSYSRVAVFNIDQAAKTIELVWQWGDERGNELFSNYVSNVQIFSDNHFLCNFGGIVYSKDTGIRTRNTGSVFAGTGSTAAVIIELLDDEVVFEAEIHGDGYNNVYRCYRNNLYN